MARQATAAPAAGTGTTCGGAEVRRAVAVLADGAGRAAGSAELEEALDGSLRVVVRVPGMQYPCMPLHARPQMRIRPPSRPSAK